MPPAFQLTDRDLKLVGHVARHRFLSSTHLAALDGGSEQNVLRCLRVLFDHGYLDRPHAQVADVPLTGPRPMVYGLGHRGARALREHGHRIKTGTDWTERNKRAGAKFIHHTLGIADLLVALEVACEARGDVTLLREHEVLASAPEQTRAAREPLRLAVQGLERKIGTGSVVADGLFGLSFPDQTAAYFLFEIDRGSMPVVRTSMYGTSFERKLKVYFEAWRLGQHVQHFGLKQIRVLTVTENSRRLDHMLAAVRKITGGNGSNFFLFAEKQRLAETSPLDLRWTSGKGELIRLTD